jgi:tRNA1(Val) A37 N6-methylase TrmN6
MKKQMEKQRLPEGWTEEQVRKLAEHHDNLTDDEQAAEIEAAMSEEGQTVMVVPTDLVPEIVKLISKKKKKRSA